MLVRETDEHRVLLYLSLDDLLRSGINLADSVVVVNKESINSAEEDFLADCNTIVAVQSMFKYGPQSHSIHSRVYSSTVANEPSIFHRNPTRIYPTPRQSAARSHSRPHLGEDIGSGEDRGSIGYF